MSIEHIKRQGKKYQEPYRPLMQQSRTRFEMGAYLVEDNVLFIVLEGEITLKTPNKEITVGSHEMILLLKGRRYDYIKSTTSDSKSFKGLFVFLCAESLIYYHWMYSNPQTHSKGNVKKEKYQLNNLLSLLAIAFYNCLDKDQYGYELQIQQVAMMFMFLHVHVYPLYDDIVKLSNQTVFHMQLLPFLGRKHTLKDFAQISNLNVSTVQRKYKEQNGSTLGYAKLKICMEISKILLIKTNLKIKTISEEVGYKRPSSFSYAYKRFYGISPREERGRAINER